MKLKAWLRLLAEPEEGADPDQTLDDVLNLDDQDPEPKVEEPDDEPPELKTAKQRAKDAEAERDREREARIRAEERARVVTPAPAQTVDPDYDREEQQLRELKSSGATPEALYWAQFRIDTERRARATDRKLSQVAIDSQDAADRLAFRHFESAKPNLYKRYGERVEKLAGEYRAKGQVVPREAILKMLVGDDMVNGTIKPTAKRPATTGPDGKVIRGQPQQVRSDVQGKGGRPKSIREKRDWANTPI